MGMFLGSLAGAGTLMLLGREWKGRDFLGLAVAMFFFALLAGAMVSPFVLMLEHFGTAGGGNENMPLVFTILMGLATFLLAFLPGLMFIALAEPRDRETNPES